MQNYILLLIGVLVILLVGVIFYGWRKVTQLEIEISKNKYDVEALRNLISKMLDNQEDTEQPQPQVQSQNIMPSNFLDMQNVQMDLHKSFVNQPESFIENKSGGEDSITIESVETTETTGGLLSDSSDEEDDENVKVKVLESDEGENIEIKEDDEGHAETEHEEDEHSEEEDELEVQNQEVVEESRVNSNDNKTNTEESDEEEEVDNNAQELAQDDENKQEVEAEEHDEEVEAEEQDEEVENHNEKEEEDEQEEEDNEEVELEGENDLEDGSEDEEENMDEKIVHLQNEKVNLENRIADNIRRGGKKNVPNNAANQYSVGYEMVSENDGKMYMVVKTGKSKRWRLKINN